MISKSVYCLTAALEAEERKTNLLIRYVDGYELGAGGNCAMCT